MVEILPVTDWSQEAVRPALNIILRRLDRLFNKINNPKRPHLKVGALGTDNNCIFRIVMQFVFSLVKKVLHLW